MGLVKCPECKRDHISDYEFVCPSCGFLIRNHFHPQTRPEKYPSMHFLNAGIDKWIQSDRERRDEEERKAKKIKLVVDIISLIITVIALLISLFGRR